MRKNVFLLFVSVVLTWIVLEIVVRVFSPARTYSRHEGVRAAIYSEYMDRELDTSIPIYTERQAGKCLSIVTSRFTWNPYFGWNAQQLDMECARSFFVEAGDTAKKVVYFGGSAMADFEAPNHLTKIDTYIQQLDETIISINLAESGARSTNNLIRLMTEGVDLGADYWIFLDGFNEFNSIKYNGSPKDDFYWAVSAYDRVHSPARWIVDRFLRTSRLLDLLIVDSGLFSSRRRRLTSISKEEVIEAADYYVENIKKISNVCEVYQVKCFFFLQPNLYTKDPLTELESQLPDYYKVMEAKKTIDLGYQRIREKAGNRIIDLSDVFDDVGTVFFDEIHFNKRGGWVLAREIVYYLQ